MNTHITTPRHFRLYGAVLAMAALLAVLLAVTLTAGTTQAQVGVGPGGLPRTGENTEEYSQPYPCTEESSPAVDTADIISEGYYAVFDAFWDYEDGHLSNNFCPPKVTVTTETRYDEEEEPYDVDVYTRADANIHIRQTAFSITDSYKVTVIDTRQGVSNGNPSTVTGDTIDIADFPFLAHDNAVSAVKTENGSTVFANNTLWWVRLDEPWTNANETSPLQIGFSTDLLEEADWYKDENGDGTAEEPVRFEFEAVHVFKDGTLYEGEEAHRIGAHMFAFDQRVGDTPQVGDTPLENARWSSVNTDTNEIRMFTDQYRQMQFAFTEPGSYLMQVHFKGHVRKERDPAPASGRPSDWSPISPDEIITSPVQWYTFHVGPQADLAVALTAGAVSTTESGSTVPITVTATNGGPDAAENVEVEINLPPGLSAPATLPSGASSNDCGVIAWKIGAMANGTSRTLTFNASVNTGATGKVTATAEIHSTTFDSNLNNNAASADATLSGTNVRAPFFPGVTRDIVEHAVAGAHAGDPVAAVSPDGRALTYTLSGPCSNKFHVHPNGQIVLAQNHTLDYEKQWEYPLVLSVSDRVDASGDADTSADDSTPVLIRVEDTDPADHPTVSFKLTPNDSDTAITGNPVPDGRTYFLRTTLNNAPAGATLTYDWDEVGWHNPVWSNRFHTSYYPASEEQPGSKTYIVHIKWPGGGISASKTITFESPSQ